jgi:hypothetical protein
MKRTKNYLRNSQMVSEVHVLYLMSILLPQKKKRFYENKINSYKDNILYYCTCKTIILAPSLYSKRDCGQMGDRVRGVIGVISNRK